MVPLATIRKMRAYVPSSSGMGDSCHLLGALCRPRKEGGVGLRSLVSVREAAGIKLAWRFLQGDSLWSAWMTSRIYGAGTSGYVKLTTLLCVFQAYPEEPSCSSDGYAEEDEEGGETDLWLDPWISGQSLLEILGPQRDGVAYRGLSCNTSSVVGSGGQRSIVSLLRWVRRSDRCRSLLRHCLMSGFGHLPAARRVQGSSDLAAATTLSGHTSMILRSTTLSGGRGLPGRCNCLHTTGAGPVCLLGTDCFGSGFLSLTLSVFV
ncbi:uncharacterized protein M6B38_417385 [Iris pallida]|uniref:Uncharacterized protein n=1 Tax=Iris pallida TaxID=29817 RepID=A0AAX6FIB1_IRIPA|nr:uncharacterized protein M6B38_417385 [Iris pallida]